MPGCRAGDGWPLRPIETAHTCEREHPGTDGPEADRLTLLSHIRSAGYDDGRLVRLNEPELKRAVVTLHNCVLRRVKALNHVLVDLLDVDEETVDQYCICAVAENCSNQQTRRHTME